MELHRDPRVEVSSSRTAFQGRIFRVDEESVRLPSGLEQHVAVVVHPGAVAVAAEEDDGRLVLVRQYRHALGRWMIELPAGRREPGEDPLATARRELDEETGLEAREWAELASFVPAPGFCSERIWLFRARGLTAASRRRAHDADEELETLRLSPAELLDGATDDGKTLVAAALIERLGRFKERGRGR